MAGPTGRRSRTVVAVDDLSTRTTARAAADERFSAKCPNLLWWFGSLVSSPRGSVESTMRVFEPLSHREVRSPFICMLSARICSTACVHEPPRACAGCIASRIRELVCRSCMSLAPHRLCAPSLLGSRFSSGVRCYFTVPHTSPPLHPFPSCRCMLQQHVGCVCLPSHWSRGVHLCSGFPIDAHAHPCVCH